MILRLRKQGWLGLLIGSLFVSGTAFAALTTPTVTSYPQFASSSPVTVSGTADASTTVTISGGAATSTTTVDGSGNWSAMVDLIPNALNSLTISTDDGMGSTSSSTMIEITFDDTAPVFGTTTDVTATTTSSSGTTVTFSDPAVTDNLSASTTVMCTPSSGTTFAVGTTTVNCTASDEAGNTASTSFDVIVEQVTGGTGTSTATTSPITIDVPTITNGQFCSKTSPIAISGTADANADISVTGGAATATTTANGSGAFNLLVDLAENSMNPIVITSTNGSTTASTTFDVVYDTVAPAVILNGDSDVTIRPDSSFDDPRVTVIDALDTNATATTSGSIDFGREGTYTLTYTATDCAGNVATTTRTVNVDADINGSGGARRGGRSTVPPGLLVAVQNASPNSAVAYVLAGFVIDGGTPGVPNTGFSLGAFLRDLMVGMRGDDVVELQTRLNLAGIFGGPITGYFGPLTKAAVIRLQHNLGLPVTGSLDFRTRAVLNQS